MRVLIGALVVAVCAWRTHARAQDWRSDEAIWQSATRSTPTRARPALNLAVIYARQGRWTEAEAWTVRAVHLMTPHDAWLSPYLCRHIGRIAALAPDPPSFSVECAS